MSSRNASLLVQKRTRQLNKKGYTPLAQVQQIAPSPYSQPIPPAGTPPNHGNILLVFLALGLTSSFDNGKGAMLGLTPSFYGAFYQFETLHSSYYTTQSNAP